MNSTADIELREDVPPSSSSSKLTAIREVYGERERSVYLLNFLDFSFMLSAAVPFTCST